MPAGSRQPSQMLTSSYPVSHLSVDNAFLPRPVCPSFSVVERIAFHWEQLWDMEPVLLVDGIQDYMWHHGKKKNV